MNRFYLLVVLLLFFTSMYSQSSICDIARGCSDANFVFENTYDNGNAEFGPDYSCLGSQQNPAWYFLEIETAGDLDITISQVDVSGTPIDVDYICYGPFNDPNIACGNASILNTGNITVNTVANAAQCAYSMSPTENLNINDAQIGEFYIILIANFSNQEGFITMTQTGGDASTSCPCEVYIEGKTTACINSEIELKTSLSIDSINPTYKWFKKVTGVFQEITGETNDTYIVSTSNVIGNDTFRVEIESDLCDDTAFDEIIITYVDVISNLKLTNITTIELCDNDNDGFDTFDLTINQAEILNTENMFDYIFTYFTDVNLTQQINSPTTYNNTTAYTETIYVTAEHVTFGGCVGETSFEIKAIDSPTATQLNDWFICDDNNDGFYTFDLGLLIEEIYNGQDVAAYAVSFHATQDDANDNLNVLALNYVNENAYTLEEIFIRIENNAITTCFETSSFNIKVVRTPEPTQLNDWIVCDDLDNDGFYQFDLSSLTADLLNGQDANDINVTFYQSQVDVDFKLTPFDLLYTNKESFEREEIFVRLESNEKEECYTTATFFIEVIKSPVFDVLEVTKYICVNLLPQTVEFGVENMQGVYSYSWKDFNGNELSTNATLQATQEGDYTITATTTEGNNCSTTKTVHLLPSIPATNIEFVMNEFWAQENFSIHVSVMGSGVYQYAIDNINGPYQEDSLLINIAPGIHTVYVKEMNDCGITSKIIDVFGFSPFFTPNGDGKHDIWKVQGINFPSLAKIYIFDRYGKSMAQFQPALNQGWNGFYNGKPAPEGEYWFTSEMTNNNGESIIRKGHFSLLRTNN